MKTTIITLKNSHVENDTQHMTSLEIAELTGKQHKDIMKAIRNMEPAWLKVNGRKFALVEYQDKKGELRPCQVNNQIMFVGKDVATALGDKNPSNALQVHVDSEDKTSYLIQVSGSNYRANTLFINESGLYSLILSSKLPQAKAFKRWVTS